MNSLSRHLADLNFLSLTMNTVIETELLSLSPAERIRLVEDIWDRIVTEPNEIPLSDSHRAEIDHRLDTSSENPDIDRPWPEFRDELLNPQ